MPGWNADLESLDLLILQERPGFQIFINNITISLAQIYRIYLKNITWADRNLWAPFNLQVAIGSSQSSHVQGLIWLSLFTHPPFFLWHHKAPHLSCSVALIYFVCGWLLITQPPWKLRPDPAQLFKSQSQPETGTVHYNTTFSMF